MDWTGAIRNFRPARRASAMYTYFNRSTNEHVPRPGPLVLTGDPVADDRIRRERAGADVRYDHILEGFRFAQKLFFSTTNVHSCWSLSKIRQKNLKNNFARAFFGSTSIPIV